MLTCQTYDVLIICFFLVFYDCWFLVTWWRLLKGWILLLFNLFEVSSNCYVSIWDVSIGSIVFIVFENGSIHPPHGIIIDCWAWIIDHHNLVLYDSNPSKVIIAISMMPQAWVMMVLLSTCFMLHWSSFTLLQPCGCLKRWGHSKGNACSIKC
jgi:hypothetical protein